MISFYSFTQITRLAIAFSGLISIAFQTVNVSLESKRLEQKNYRIRQILEYAILLNLAISGSVPAILNYTLRDGFLIDTVFQTERTVAYIILFAVTTIKVISDKKTTTYIINLIMLLCLPVFEEIYGYFFHGFVVVMIYFSCRSMYMIRKNYRETIKGISVWSIKKAIDNMQSGILFCKRNGIILLVNDKMQNLMEDITGKIQNDANLFYKKIVDISNFNEKNLFDDERVIVQDSEKKFWRFTKENFIIESGKKEYVQIVATDVTKEWNLINQMQIQDAILKNKAVQMREMIDNMFFVQVEKEKNTLKAKLHDLMSQKITLFQRLVQRDCLPTPREIFELIESLEDGMIEEDDEYSEENLDTLIKQFADIGVTINVDGTLPNIKKYTTVFALVTREALTNSVRHSGATVINIRFSETEKDFIMEISDDGVMMKKDKDTKYKGNGLRIMRERLEKVGGFLEIRDTERFVVRAIILKEENYD